MSAAAPRSAAFDDLVAMNDEIAALVRAGVPLETGFSGSARAASEQLQDVTARIARRVGDGATVDEALAAEGDRLPSVYRALVEAGRRSGRATGGVEALAGFSRRLKDVQRRISLSLIHPFVVLVVAYYLFWFAAGEVLPGIGAIAREPGEPDPGGWASTFDVVHRAIVRAGHLPPVLAVAGLAAWFLLGRSTSPTHGLAGTVLRSVPGLAPAVRQHALANFAELAAILIEHGVPLPTAWTLAADATGDPRLRAAAAVLADCARRNEPPSGSALAATSLPPFVQWMIRAGQREGALAPALRRVQATYLHRAVQRFDRFQALAPVVLVLVVGGGVVFCYALAFWLPFVETVRNLSEP